MTNDPTIDARIRKLRNHGSNKRNVHSFGFNSRLDDLHAGVLSAKLKHIHAWNDQRHPVGGAIHRRPEGRTNIELPSCSPATATSFTFTSSRPGTRRTVTGWSTSWSRTASTRRRTTRSPFTSRTDIPGAKARAIVGSVANAETNAASCVSLPMYPELTAEEVDYVVGKSSSGTSRRSDRRATASSLSAWASAACTMPPAFAANPRFELAGICRQDQKRLEAAAAKLGVSRERRRDAQKLADEVKPDVFCFCTPPDVRLPLIQHGDRERREADRLREAGRA